MGITSYFKSAQTTEIAYKKLNEKGYCFSIFNKIETGVLTYTIPVSEKKQGETPIYRNPNRPDSLIEEIVESNQTIKTLQDLLQYSCNKYCNEKYLATLVNGNYEFKTYGQVLESSRCLASAILHLQLFKEDLTENLKLNAVYSKNREEWLILEYACASYGMQTVPLYDTLGKQGIQFILKQTECKTIFCSLECLLQLAKLNEKQYIENIVCFDKVTPDSKEYTIIENYLKSQNLKLMDYQELLLLGKSNLKEYPKVDPDDVYCLSYTSGTTGDPKGAMITHKNQIAVSAHLFQSDLGQFFIKGRQISFMPYEFLLNIICSRLAHVFEKMLNWNYLFGGSQVFYYRGDVRFLKDDILLVKPTFLAGVPRVFTRIYDKMKEKIEELKGIKGFVARRALQTKLNAFNSNGALSNKLLDYFVFSQFREAFGGQIQGLASASAPLSEDIEKFLKITCSMPVYLAYGMTENCASGIITNCYDISYGHLGGPSLNSELKLISIPELNYSADSFPPKGEVLLRGPSVFKKYYKAEEQTNAAIDSEGWLHTGDVAEMVFDNKVNGAIRIIDRVKNIFKLQQGEYIASEKLESIYNRAQGVQEIVIYGDSFKTYIIAVVVPLREVLEKYAQEHNIQYEEYNELCKNPKINAWILDNLVKEAKQNTLNSLETVKKIYVEPVSFGDQDLFTPSFKIKKFLFKEKYANVIKSLYELN